MIFGVFEAGMPIVGLLIGRRFATELGEAVRWPAAVLLIAIGAISLVRSIREGRRNPAPSPRAAVIPAGGSPAWAGCCQRAGAQPGQPGDRVRARHLRRGVPRARSIGAVSVAMSLAGLELGGLLGRWAGRRSEQMSGVILILIGAAIAGGALT